MTPLHLRQVPLVPLFGLAPELEHTQQCARHATGIITVPPAPTHTPRQSAIADSAQLTKPNTAYHIRGTMSCRHPVTSERRILPRIQQRIHPQCMSRVRCSRHATCSPVSILGLEVVSLLFLFGAGYPNRKTRLLGENCTATASTATTSIKDTFESNSSCQKFSIASSFSRLYNSHLFLISHLRYLHRNVGRKLP